MPYGSNMRLAGDRSAYTMDAPLAPAGYQQLTSLSAASSLNVASGATMALIQAESFGVRWRDDGVAPTSATGMLIPANGELSYTGSLGALKMIEAQASAKANVSYYY